MDEPWDPGAPIRERLIARGPAVAVALAIAVAWARLIWLWTSGIIKTEPFFGSTPWNIAIFAPAAGAFAAWWGITWSRERKVERTLSALMPTEPFAGWHLRIRAFDAKLARERLSPALDLEIWRLTLDVVEAYPAFDATQREHVRLLWRTYRNFGLYASAEERVEGEDAPLDLSFTAEDVRRELILHSIRDQRPDARDAAVDLADLRVRAIAAGIDFGALACEVAALSDDTRQDGMFGSTREAMLRQA